MTKTLILAATTLALSSAAVMAQVVYVAPGYGYGYVAPAYVAPAYAAPIYMAPPPVYVAPGFPAYGYGYGSGYVDAYSVASPDWGW